MRVCDEAISLWQILIFILELLVFVVDFGLDIDELIASIASYPFSAMTLRFVKICPTQASLSSSGTYSNFVLILILILVIIVIIVTIAQIFTRTLLIFVVCRAIISVQKLADAICLSFVLIRGTPSFSTI